MSAKPVQKTKMGLKVIQLDTKKPERLPIKKPISKVITPNLMLKANSVVKQASSARKQSPVKKLSPVKKRVTHLMSPQSLSSDEFLAKQREKNA